MLHRETVEGSTLELLKSINSNTTLSELEFALAGGTSLALQLGHRKSIDLDFFTTRVFDHEEIKEALSEYHIHLLNQAKNTLSLYVNQVKLEFLRHNYPLLNDMEVVDDIRFYSIEDIAAMKLNAIVNRGSKKDFFDVCWLLHRYTGQELLNFYLQKYSNASDMLVVKSLFYFKDAESDPDPIMLHPISWEEVKSAIRKKFGAIV